MPKINAKTVANTALNSAKFLSKHAGGDKIPILRGGLDKTDKLINSKNTKPVDPKKAIAEEKSLEKLTAESSKVNNKLEKAGKELTDMKMSFDYAISELVQYYSKIILEARHVGIDTKDLFSSAIAYGASSYIKKEFEHLESTKKKYFYLNTKINNANKTNEDIRKKVNTIKGIESELSRIENLIDQLRKEKSTIENRIFDLNDI